MGAIAPTTSPRREARWQPAFDGVVGVQGNPHLLEVVEAREPSGRAAGGLHAGQQQADQAPDDGDHHEELHCCGTVHGRRLRCSGSL